SDVAAAYILSKFRSKKIAIVHDKTIYGQGLAEAIKKAMINGGMQEVLYEGINKGEKDYSVLVSKIKGSGADLVYWGGLYPEGATLYSYAALQVIAHAAADTRSLDPRKVAEVTKSGKVFKTVIGDLVYDRKGDTTRPNYVMYVWRKGANGKITFAEE